MTNAQTDVAREPELIAAERARATRQSPPMTVYDCIVGVSQEIAQTGISKSRSNQQQGYKFRGIDDVLNALSPLLAKYRLVILPRILSRTVVEHSSRSGGVLFYVTVEAEFDFVSAADGSQHTVKTYGEAMDSADKATNKAMSAAYKYAAFQTFCIPTEGDNDADATTPEPVSRLRHAPASPPRAREKPAAADGGETAARFQAPVAGPSAPGGTAPVATRSESIPSGPNGGGSGNSSRDHGEDDELPPGALLVTSVELMATKNANVKKALINFSDGKVRSTINTPLINAAEAARVARTPVYVTDKHKPPYGYDLVTLSAQSPEA